MSHHKNKRRKDMNERTIFKLIVFVVLLIVTLLLGTCSFEIVDPGHRGVSVTLGKVNPTVLPEGLNFKKPFVETIYEVDAKQRTIEGKASAFSSDLQTVEVAFKVLYRLPEGQIVTLFQQYKGDPYETLIEPRIQEELKQTTSLYRAEELVRSREKIKAEVLQKVKAVVGGLLFIEDMAITNFDFTDELERAIEQKTIREQEALAKNFELDKERKQAEITIVQAEAEARSVKIKGEALKSSPEVIGLEIVKKWDGKAPTTVVTDSKGGASILLPGASK